MTAKISYKIVLVLSALVLPIEARADCPKGTHFVKEHFRHGYKRFDGSVVSPTTVKAHCRTNSFAFEKWFQNFVDFAPAKWPHKENFKEWNEHDGVKSK